MRELFIAALGGGLGVALYRLVLHQQIMEANVLRLRRMNEELKRISAPRAKWNRVCDGAIVEIEGRIKPCVVVDLSEWRKRHG